ncbi:MAG: YjbQ family protein [Candidatus Eisenbacteria bacterium]|nr:YjbQ family protein [Candidatus Eisenbacteria bacterium]
MTVHTGRIAAETRGNGDTINVTAELAGIVEESGLRSGLATLFIGGSTAGITTIEFEPGAVSDLASVFEEIAPQGRDWRHHERWGDYNGHSHVRSALLGPSLTVPFVDGRLTLGTWQQVVLVDFDDKARAREVVVQLVGE